MRREEEKKCRRNGIKNTKKGKIKKIMKNKNGMLI